MHLAIHPATFRTTIHWGEIQHDHRNDAECSTCFPTP